MKFIGQFIQNFIARFRSDVYLENIADGTVANDKFLGLDSNNKIVKETVTSSSGDITDIAIRTDSGSSNMATQTEGSASFSILGGVGTSVTNSGTTITVRSEDGEIDHDSLSNFVAAEHVDWAGSSAGTIHSTNIPTLNQDTTGNATTATNLVASTSTAVQLGTIELGHASDTTLSRSAGGTLAVEGKNVRTEDKNLFIKQGSFASDSSGFATSDVIFFPMTGTAENTSANGTAQPFLAPANGKLLQLHIRSNKDHSPSSETQIFTLRNWDDDEQFTSNNKTILAQKTVTGVQKNAVLTIDFRTGLDSTANADTNEFTVGETLCIGMQNGFDTNTTTKYYFTAVFEFDFSSY